MTNSAVLNFNYNILRTRIPALKLKWCEPRSCFLGGITPRLNHDCPSITDQRHCSIPENGLVIEQWRGVDYLYGLALMLETQASKPEAGHREPIPPTSSQPERWGLPAVPGTLLKYAD